MAANDVRARVFPILTVVDSNVFPHTRSWLKPLENLAQAGFVRLFWSPWIISEANRVLTWQWLRRRRGDTSARQWAQCSEQAKAMFDHLTRAFEVVEDRPPHPTVWSDSPRDNWDVPIYTAAKRAAAAVVVTENLDDAPPPVNGLRMWEKVLYLGPEQFLDFVPWAIDEIGSAEMASLDDTNAEAWWRPAADSEDVAWDTLLRLVRAYRASRR